MRRPRILFIPSFLGTPSHFIPLVKLYQQLDCSRYDAAFFLPQLTLDDVRNWQFERYIARAEYYYCGEFYSRFDIPTLSLKRQYTVASELRAYSMFKPDLIIDDCNITTVLTNQVRRKQRITMLRSGALASNTSRAPGHRHTLDTMISTLPTQPNSSFTLPRSLEGYFEASAYLIPGIASIELSHCTPEGRSRSFFCGPLILDEREEEIFQFEELLRFFAGHTGSPIAYVTFGTASARNPEAQVIECFHHLLELGFSVLTNVPLERLGGDALIRSAADRCLFSDVFPMHYVTSKADIVVHVASSGMYHYPILHGKPAITIGTQTYDRECIAETMAALGLSLHIPAPTEVADFGGLFRNALEVFLAARFPFDADLGNRLAACRQEIERTAREFDFQRVIDVALAS
jgi:hypothetical protein